MDKYSRIFITKPFEKEIAIYKLKDNNQLQKIGGVQIGGYPLNIQYNKQRDEFYIGCLLKLSDLITVYRDIKTRANGSVSSDIKVNSMVIRIKNSKYTEKLDSYEEVLKTTSILGIFSATFLDSSLIASSAIGDSLL